MMSSNHHPGEKDYWYETVEVTTSDGQVVSQKTYLLRIYPENFNGYDAYMDIPLSEQNPNFNTIHFSKLGVTWKVVAGPFKSSINGTFRGDNTTGNPPAWIFGLIQV